jgi:hypothetical protein
MLVAAPACPLLNRSFAAAGLIGAVKGLLDTADLIVRVQKRGFMKMFAKAVKEERGWYESPSPRRKVDDERVRQIIQREIPDSDPARQNGNENDNGSSRSSREERVST